jgi:hypothetical protein
MVVVRFLRRFRPEKKNVIQAKIPMIIEPRVPRQGFQWIPVRDPEIYPLLFCVSIGFSMLLYYGYHEFTTNPEINLNRQRRHTQTLQRFQPKETEPFTRHHHQFATLVPNPINQTQEHQQYHQKS